MKSDDLILLAAGAVLLYLIWQHDQTQGGQLVATGAGPAPTGVPQPSNPVYIAPAAGLTGAALTAAKAAGTAWRAPTATGQPAGVPFGQQAVDRTKPRPADTAYKPRATTTTASATSRALNNSTLNTAEQLSIAGGVATAKAFGIPPAVSRPIAKYGNPVALGKDVVSAGKAVGSFFGGLF